MLSCRSLKSKRRNARWVWRVLALCALVAGLTLLLLIDSPQDSSETVTVAEQAAASDSNCPNRINPITGRCRSCADRTQFRSNGKCVQKTMNHPNDPPCTDGKVYYSTYGCREVECPLGPPHGDAARDDDGYCLPDPGTTPPPPTTTPPTTIPPTTTPPPVIPPGKPRNVSVTAGVGSLTVRWTQPSSTGSSDITGWYIHYSYQKITGSVTSTSNKTHPVVGGGIPTDGAIITGLEHDTTYQVRVKAESDAGEGDFSSPISARTAVPAVTLVGLEVTQGLQDWEGTIKLVKGKTTIVRAFLEPWGNKTATKSVSVRLKAFRLTSRGYMWEQPFRLIA